MRVVPWLVVGLLLLLGPRSLAEEVKEIVVVVDPSNPIKSLSASELEAIFTSRRLTWSGDVAIVAFNLSPGDAVRVAFDKAVLGMNADEAGRYWVDQRIRGGPRPPRQVGDPVLMLRLVGRLRGAIGYAPIDKLIPGARVVARIRNGKVVSP
jgi:ABC-type phosphate transport system substrate-binding protein